MFLVLAFSRFVSGFDALSGCFAVGWSNGFFCFSLFTSGENASLTLNISSLLLEILARREPSQLESPNSPAESEIVNTKYLDPHHKIWMHT